MMEQDLNYYSRISALRQKLNNRSDFSVKVIYDKICKRPSPKSFGSEQLRLFLRGQKCIAQADVLSAIFRRIDKDKDDQISYVEFTEIMLQPQYEKSNRGNRKGTHRRSLTQFKRRFESPKGNIQRDRSLGAVDISQ